jgi:two-component system NarL family sensor kinase
VQFGLTGLFALVLVAVGGSFVLRQQGTRESLRDSREFARTVARGIIEPNLTESVLDGSRQARVRLDRIVRRHVLSRQVVRVKLWVPPGRIVYSDEPRLIGARFRMDEDELAALRTGQPATDVSDLSAPENRFERRYGKLVEVYYPVHTLSGTPLLFETYIRSHAIMSGAREIWLTFLPVLAAALVALWLVQLPLAWSLARRVRRHDEEHAELLQRAVESSAAERRRIAADLHDGVVQDLAGIALGLSGTANRLGDEVEPGVRGALRTSAEGTRQAMRRLRSLLVEIHPPNLQNVGLRAALADLAAPLAARDIDIEIDVPAQLDLRPEVEALLFRGAQEALRNLGRHAGARHAAVRVSVEDGHAALVVADDGRGFTADEVTRRREEGHVGLRLLGDLAESAGGKLRVDSEPERGTELRLEVSLA